uniref:Piwi domain-containing protein n=1 Tax=Caenorhabditis japonica TaxID=281687 RepID=A0A8R1DXK7_CAEJA
MPGPYPLPPVTAPPVGYPPIAVPPAPHPPVAQPPVVVPPVGLPPPPVPPVGPGPIPVLPVESTHKTSNDACIKRLRQLLVDPAPRIYPTAVQPGTAGAPFLVQTNVFGVEVRKRTQIFQYVVHIKADLTNKKEVVFTKKGKEDFIVLDRHSKCCDIFFDGVQKFDNFFKTLSGNQLIYDGQNMLFSTSNLFEGVSNLEQRIKLMQIDGSQLKSPELHTLPVIILEVYASKNPPIYLAAEEIARRTADSNIAANNRAFEQILELLFNQHCLRDPINYAFFENGKMFFLDPGMSGFEQGDYIDVGDGKKILPGLKKRLQFIEGPHGRGQNNPALVIDSMKVAFHKEETIGHKFAAILQKDPARLLADYDREKCAQIIKGLDCYTTYTGRTRHLKIEAIHHSGADTARFELKEGGSVTVAEYFLEKYKKRLSYPSANLIICKERGNNNYFPMELLTISKNQRVKISQQTSTQSQLTTREGAVIPPHRQRLIMTSKTGAEIRNENPLLQDFGVYICDDPLLLKAREIPSATIEYDGRPVAVEHGKWRAAQGHYHRPAVAPKIWAIYAVGTQDTRFTQNDLVNFVKEYVSMCNSKGIKISPPKDCQLVDVDVIENQLMIAVNAKCDFVLMITDDTITHVHQMYKLIERNHQVIVQDMMISKALSIITKAKRLTLENIINKTNVKLGGTNYVVSDKKKYLDNQLIIGIGISATPFGSKTPLEGKTQVAPTILGFAHNALTPQEFTGDFLLNSTGQDTFAPIEDILKQAIGQYKNARNSLPQRVIVYRTGANEGAHGAIISFEIPLARIALKHFSEEIKLIYIIGSKDHVNRFFRNFPAEEASIAKSQSSRSSVSSGPKSSELNIPPGICVDDCVTSPACRQFFLNSHTTLQGTAKTPLYTVLADDCNSRMDTLEELTYSLCHNHQIVSLTTSIPTPLYVAMEYAKRGRNLWGEILAARGPLERTIGSEMEQLQGITDEISYKNAGMLITRRVNA